MATCVLLADQPGGCAVMRRAMTGYDIIEEANLDKAKQQLERTDIDLLLIGIHFDDSQALEFVKAAREHKNHRSTPIVMFRTLPSDMADFLRACIRDVGKFYQIFSYIETDHLTSSQAIREAIEAALPIEKRCAPVRTKTKVGRIMLAASPEPQAILHRLLDRDHREFLDTSTVEDAERHLKTEKVDGIIATVLFDSGRIFDLLRLVRSTPKWQNIPFICARVRPGTLDTPAAIRGLKEAFESNGAVGFVDISDYHNDSNPERQLATVIDELLHSSQGGNRTTNPAP